MIDRALGEELRSAQVAIPGIDGRTPLEPSLMAGALAGVAGLLTFLVIHALWITPIWVIAPVAVPAVALFGAVVGWSFRELAEVARLPGTPPVRGLVLAAMLMLTLLPVLGLGVLLGPVPQTNVELGQVLLPLLLSAPAGVLIGWLLTRAWRASLALGAAALAISLLLGHNVPFFPLGSAGADKLLVIMAVVAAVAGVTLGVCTELLRPHASLRGGQASK